MLTRVTSDRRCLFAQLAPSALGWLRRNSTVFCVLYDGAVSRSASEGAWASVEMSVCDVPLRIIERNGIEIDIYVRNAAGHGSNAASSTSCSRRSPTTKRQQPRLRACPRAKHDQRPSGARRRNVPTRAMTLRTLQTGMVDIEEAPRIPGATASRAAASPGFRRCSSPAGIDGRKPPTSAALSQGRWYHRPMAESALPSDFVPRLLRVMVDEGVRA